MNELFASADRIQLWRHTLAAEQELGKGWARDPGAFDALYRENAPRLKAFLRQIVGSPQAAEDLTQEIFVQLWTRPEGFDPARGSLRAYLFGIGRHRASDWWRRTKPGDSVADDRYAASNPERDLLIGDALRRLPEEQRTLLWLREVEGQTYAELAAIFDIPIGTVRSRLFLARHALREIWQLAPKGGDLHEVR